MSAPQQVASTAQEQAGAVAGTAKDQAASVAQSATTAAAEVTGTAREQAGSVVGETVAQARDLSGQVKQQAAQQVSSQTEKATTALRDVARQLNDGDTSGVVGTVLAEVGTRVHGLADALERKGPQGLLDDVRRYARHSPGTFVLGAALAGLVTGRLAKGMTAKTEEQLALPVGPRGLAGTAAGDPLAGVTSPGVSHEVPIGGAYETSTTTFGAPSYGAPGPAPEPAYAPPAYTPPPAYTSTPAYTPPPAYPSTGGTDDAPFAAGRPSDEPYGTRGAL